MQFLNKLAVVLISMQGILGLERINGSTKSDEELELVSGFRVALQGHELRIKLDVEKMFSREF